MTKLTLQSTFPIFPDGIPGLGLLLLRATAGIAIVCSGVILISGGQEARVLSLIVATLSLLCGLLLLLGLFNRLSCSLTAMISLGAALALIPVPIPNILLVKVSAGFVAVIVIALLCLGPGAYSFDARRHGRREIVIPVRHRSSGDNPL